MNQPIYTLETASASCRAIFDAMAQARGFVPNVYAVFGALPDAMTAFAGLTGAFGASSLTPAEREVIQLAVSVANRCRYCVAGHSAFAGDAGLDAAHVEAMRHGNDPDDRRFGALARFARKLATERGHNCASEYAAFLAAGYRSEQALEVIVGIANKTLSNMTANLLNLPLDTEFAPFVWSPMEDAA